MGATMRTGALALALVALLGRPAAAQSITTEPVHVVVALGGIVVVSAGFGMMLHTRDGMHSDPGWLAGGVVVVAAGVALVYLGLRERPVSVAPIVTRRALGGAVAIRWGGR